MSFILQAPFDLIQTTTVLPNPTFGDNEGNDIIVKPKRAMDNTLYTTVKDSGLIVLSYGFYLTRFKQLELAAFIRSYYGVRMRITNHKSEVWFGWLMTESPDAVAVNRAEYRTVNMQFKAVKQ